MCFIYSTFQLAETMAERLADDARTAMAVFVHPALRNLDDTPMVGVSPLAEFSPIGRELLVIYEPGG